MSIKNYISLILFGLLLFPQLCFAQVDFNKPPDDDLGNIEDKYQEYFFEALKQKGIENYDRSITALLKCLKLDDSKSVVYFELGKNYVKVKNFGAAEDALKKAISKAPENEWFLNELYGLYYTLNDYDKALKTVKQLVKFHPDYKEDLVALYVKNERFKAALKVLDELDAQYGISKARDLMRNKIYNATGDDKDRIENLEQRISANPKNESNYLNLIYRYSENGDKESAFRTAEKLLIQKPESQLVHLALYKFYLDDHQEEKAITSMKIVLKSSKIKPEAKAKVLNDFVVFVRANPEYESSLLEITSLISGAENGKSQAELGYYYLQKGDKSLALKHYQLALEKEANNFSIIKNVILLLVDGKQYEAVINLAEMALETFPAQPIIYLAHGVALNHLNRPNDAIETLELGVDYVIDNKQMEADFYLQMSTAYKMNNNITKSRAFAKKAAQLLKTQ